MAGTKRKLSSKGAQGAKNENVKKPKTKGTLHAKVELPAPQAPEDSDESGDESGFDSDDPWEGLVGSETPRSATDSLDVSDTVQKNGVMNGKTTKAANETKKKAAPPTQPPSKPKQSAKSDAEDEPVVTAGTVLFNQDVNAESLHLLLPV